MSRPFHLTVDSANIDEPSPRTFGSLEAALSAFRDLDESWQKFAWITESRDGRTVVHMRDGTCLVHGSYAGSSCPTCSTFVHPTQQQVSGQNGKVTS